MIAVPAYPPESSKRHHQERLLSIIDDAEPRLLLTSAGLRDALQQIEGAPPLLCVDTLDCALAERWVEPNLTHDHLAFLQYTSGSTSTPKGVQVSHCNLVANERVDEAQVAAFQRLCELIGVSAGLSQRISQRVIGSYPYLLNPQIAENTASKNAFDSADKINHKSKQRHQNCC